MFRSTTARYCSYTDDAVFAGEATAAAFPG
jgi:hypothetical protein